MNAYGNVIALGGGAAIQTLVQSMEPKVNSEEDAGSMAQFMEDMSSKSANLDPEDKKQKDSTLSQTGESADDQGAMFAAEFGQEIEE